LSGQKIAGSIVKTIFAFEVAVLATVKVVFFFE